MKLAIFCIVVVLMHIISAVTPMATGALHTTLIVAWYVGIVVGVSLFGSLLFEMF